MPAVHSRHLSIGPGGRRCACCFPAPGSKDRRSQFRRAKRRVESEVRREIEAEFIEMEDTIPLYDEIEDDSYDFDPFDDFIDEYDEPPFEEEADYDFFSYDPWYYDDY